MKYATIEIRSKPILGTFMIGKYAPHHMYIIYTNSNDEEFILRGGPTDNMLTSDLEIVNVKYEQEFKNNEIHKDWDNKKTHLKVEIACDTEEEILALYQKMQARGEAINKENFDYKLPTIGHVQNSNTAVKEMVEAAGLTLVIPKHKDGTPAWVPGVDGSFTHTFIDTIINDGILPNIFTDNYARQLNKFNNVLTFINKQTGLEVYKYYTHAYDFNSPTLSGIIVPWLNKEKIAEIFGIAPMHIHEVDVEPVITENTVTYTRAKVIVIEKFAVDKLKDIHFIGNNYTSTYELLVNKNNNCYETPQKYKQLAEQANILGKHGEGKFYENIAKQLKTVLDNTVNNDKICKIIVDIPYDLTSEYNPCTSELINEDNSYLKLADES